MNTRLQDAPTPTSDSQRRSIEDALASEIRVPMAALRAALENLARQDEGALGHTQVLEAAADEVGRLSHKVCSLIDAALASPAAASTCRVGDIRERLCRALDPRLLPAVHIACEDAWAAVEVDPAAFTAALAGLIESFTRDGGEVLVRLRYMDGLDVRLVTEGKGCPQRADSRPAEELRLAFAEHELEAQGVRIHWRTSQSGAVRIALRHDDRDAFGGAA